MSTFETGSLFFSTSEHWEPDFITSKEPNLLKIDEPDFAVKILNCEAIFCG